MRQKKIWGMRNDSQIGLCVLTFSAIVKVVPEDKYGPEEEHNECDDHSDN